MPIPFKPLPIHKCQYLANCSHFTSVNSLQTVANSQVPIPCKLLPIHKCQYLTNCFQFTSYNSLQTVANSQVSIPCKLLQIHKCQFLANCCQLPSANTLPTIANTFQTVVNSQVPIPCKLLPIHRCQYLANCCRFRIATLELANSFNSQVPRLFKLISTQKCPTKACKPLQFTNANTLQPVATSEVQNQSLKVPRTCELP